MVVPSAGYALRFFFDRNRRNCDILSTQKGGVRFDLSIINHKGHLFGSCLFMFHICFCIVDKDVIFLELV